MINVNMSAVPMLVVSKVKPGCNDENLCAFLEANINTPLLISSISYYGKQVSHVCVKYKATVATIFNNDADAQVIWVAPSMVNTYLLRVKYPDNKPVKVDIPLTCSSCGYEHVVSVYNSDWEDYCNGNKYAQEAFPYLSADERELFISGFCSSCFDSNFNF